MVDAVVTEWLRQIMSDEVAIEGVGKEIRTMLACFYADDGLVACHDPNLLQRALDALTAGPANQHQENRMHDLPPREDQNLSDGGGVQGPQGRGVQT